ncbi:AAA family ATPase, partial [Ralstonia solanacearum]
MELVELRVENFKKIEDVTIALRDVNILVGPNGCGKSSVVQAVHLASCVMRQADRVAADKTATVNVDDLDYLPTDDYKTLGHGGNWGNKEGTPSSRETLIYQSQPSSLTQLR